MGIKSIPTRIIYSVDVPEVTELKTEFVYNYFVTNEAVRDKDILTDDAIKNMNLSQNIISKPRTELAESYLDYGSRKFPRYVKITFKGPKKIPYIESGEENDIISQNIDKIVSETQFATSYYTAINFKNNEIDKQTASIFKNASMLLNDTKEINSSKSVEAVKSLIGSSDEKVVGNVLSQQEYIANTIFKKNDGKKTINNYLDNLKNVSTNAQVSNNLLYDLVQRASNDSLNINKNSFKTIKNQLGSKRNNNSNFDLTEDEFKTNIQYTNVVSSADDANVPTTYKLVGYIIEKTEIFPDGTQRNFDPIVIEDPRFTSYADFDVRYGTVYIYQVKSIMEATFAAVDNVGLGISMISSLISSKPVISYVETTEDIAPPPPTGLKFVWDFDRINPTTAEFDHTSNSIIPGTGVRGSLLIYWSFPINSQMDIKKFQVFRRKNLEDPFELLKVFDFNDAAVKFPDEEKKINQKLVEIVTPNPESSYYDDDFSKKSEYIYSVAAVDAHGISSNYSEQFHVRFDQYANKLITRLVSTQNAPKSYPNMYLEKDLFLDSVKTSNKNTMHFYFTPSCYSVSNDNVKTDVVVTENGRYKVNFINIENQDSTQLTINLKDFR
jgi:hypothetical protein